ncbi:dual specificity protein phosphatase [Desulfatibacillum aliphaticivorans]|uniref:Dual specificity protein phosphatase n=1 Tax=Desulfatibacillum aliphaticivorans TaxID=218208 RepID=B8FDT4_DESAL|nr:dual specificity protein phosphatase family protein [Desulfatibacillum aliphaticivorans]ACL06715.1 dual specificity protein phosphatase [Desulfatibacillum aliphaticivorans]
MGVIRQPHPLLDQILFGLLGPYPVAGMGEPWKSKIQDTLAALREKGVGAVLTLTEEDYLGLEYTAAGFLHLHAPIDDYEAPGRKTLELAVDFIDHCLDQGVGVAAHCLEGRGRTGTVLAAWLARKENLDGEAAIRRVRSLRPITALSPAQKQFLLDYLG